VSSTTPNAIALFLVTGIGAFGGEAQPGGVEGLEAAIDQSSQLTGTVPPQDFMLINISCAKIHNAYGDTCDGSGCEDTLLDEVRRVLACADS
jgi:hypothetical protein